MGTQQWKGSDGLEGMYVYVEFEADGTRYPEYPDFVLDTCIPRHLGIYLVPGSQGVYLKVEKRTARFATLVLSYHDNYQSLRRFLRHSLPNRLYIFTLARKFLDSFLIHFVKPTHCRAAPWRVQDPRTSPSVLRLRRHVLLSKMLLHFLRPGRKHDSGKQCLSVSQHE